MTVKTNLSRSSGVSGMLANLSLATKLVLAFVAVVALAVGILTYYVNANTSRQLIDNQGNNLRERSEQVASSVVTLLNNEALSGIRTLSLNKLIQDYVGQLNLAYLGTPAEIQAQINSFDQQWVNAADSDELIQLRLTNEAASELIEYKNTFPDHVEMLATDRYGALVAATGRTSDFYQGDEEWWQKAWNNGQGGTYIGQPTFDESSNTVSIISAVPLTGHNEAGAEADEVIGVLRTTFKFERVASAIADFTLGNTGQAEMFFPDATFLDGDIPDQIQPAAAEDIAVLKSIGDQTYLAGQFEGERRLLSAIPLSSVSDQVYISDLGWLIAVSQNETETLSLVTATTQNILGVGAVILIIAVLVAILLARIIASPISRLTRVTQQFASGDLAQRAVVGGQDEIGLLASGFNNMAEQLQEQFNTLEERVAERTRDLQAVSEVSGRVATILEPERLLRDVVDLTKERFRLYHAHIYLVDDSGEILNLTAGAGYVGRQMVAEKRTIDMDNQQSIVAGAARSRKGVIVNDVRESPTFLPHPLLPDTRAELAVPLVARGQLLGVLDVQSSEVGYFNENNLAVIELMASQIAAAISNARLYETAERTSRHERALGSIERKIQGALSMDEILQTGVRELGKALRVPYTAIELQLPTDDTHLNSNGSEN